MSTARQKDGQERERASAQAPARSLSERVAVATLWLVAWQGASMLMGSSILFAGPLQTLSRLVALLGEPSFLATVAFSLGRIVGGFLVAYVSAVVMAFVAHRWPLVERLFAPAILALKTVPIACVIVLLLIWVGSRKVSGIAVVLAIFPAVYFSCAEGLDHVDGALSEMLQTFDTPPAVRLFSQIWPQVLPYLVGTAKNVCGMAWKAGVAAELIGSPRGSIGERIYQAKILLETADLFAWTIVVVALSVVCEYLFVALLVRSDRPSRHLALAIARRISGATRADSVPAAIVLGDATLGYDTAVVSRGTNVSCCPGSRSVLTDASGAGKTTLLRTVAGLQPVLRVETMLLPPTVSMVFQDARLVEQMTAVENVQLVAGAVCDEQAIRAALTELLAPEFHDVPVAELSGGQRRRVEVARALLCPASAVLLDEPFASLDEQTHEQVAAFVRSSLQGRTLLVASHAVGDVQLLAADELRLFGE